MMLVKDYRQTASEHEAVFRNVLTDMRDNRRQRPMGCYVPEDLKVDLPLEEFFEMYSAGRRYGVFTICDFQIPQPDKAIISFGDVACLSGGGAELEYLVREDDSVDYQRPGNIFMS